MLSQPRDNVQRGGAGGPGRSGLFSEPHAGRQYQAADHHTSL